MSGKRACPVCPASPYQRPPQPLSLFFRRPLCTLKNEVNGFLSLKDEARMSSLAQPSKAGSAFRPASRPRSQSARGYAVPAKSLDAALDTARSHLLRLQKPDGHWCGELQGDTILESEYVMLMAYLGRESDERVHKAGRYILAEQRPEGAWANYPGGPVDLSVSVKAYFALKLCGYPADHPDMARAARLIRDAGGAAGCNSFTKFYLAILGQYPYDNCASVPPEMMFLPTWFPGNIYSMSSWTRTIVVPLAIFSAHRPLREVPPERGIRELFIDDPMTPTWPCPPSKSWLSWTNFFLGVDWAFKKWQRWGPRWLRNKAIEKATRWMLDHFDDSDGVGAIYPPIIYTIICLKCLGYADDSQEMNWALRQLEDLFLVDGDTMRVQPCFSPVWDTALTLNALSMAGFEGQEDAIERAAQWLFAREVRRPGDFSVMNPNLVPGGWFFEYRNGYYPDTDDTAMVLMGLARSGQAWGSGELLPATRRGINWLLGMQNSDGGWAAFDRDITLEVLTKVPFADHNAMLDPSCPDITARVLEALGQYGHRPGAPHVDRALAFLEETQDKRGCWIGRWGVNYLYGTWQVLVGLEAIGYDMDRPMVRRAIKWLNEVQQASGGWGESCHSYDDPATAGQGPTTASQTAWALLGLIAAGEANSDSVRAGIQFLIERQLPDGNWLEDEFTGTGFPKVFYLKYHLYRLYFPLMALARFRNAT
jgi:squalene-hopene/tetraprenyl-beta-curcumene cyclase